MRAALAQEARLRHWHSGNPGNSGVAPSLLRKGDSPASVGTAFITPRMSWRPAAAAATGDSAAVGSACSERKVHSRLTTCHTCNKHNHLISEIENYMTREFELEKHI